MPVGRAFVSYSSRDWAFVQWLTDVLRQCGIRYWCSAEHLPGGALWHDEIGKALGRSDSFILVLSPAAVRSRYVQYEARYTLVGRGASRYSVRGALRIRPSPLRS